MKDHFDKTFWYIAGTTATILTYIILVTFLQVPKENQRFVDIALAFLLGRMSSNDSYLTGGTPSQPKKPITDSTVSDAITNGDQVTVTKD
jgi:hypothetical protein